MDDALATIEQLKAKYAEMHASIMAHRIVALYLLDSECRRDPSTPPLMRHAQLHEASRDSAASFQVGDPSHPLPPEVVAAMRNNALIELESLFRDLKAGLVQSGSPKPATKKPHH